MQQRHHLLTLSKGVQADTTNYFVVWWVLVEYSCFDQFPYGNLGRVFKSRDYDRAKKYFEDDLAIVTEIGVKAGEASCYAELGQMSCSLGDYGKGKEYLKKALAMATDIGDRGGEATCYISLGQVFTNLGDFVKGKEYLEKALVIKTDIGGREGEAACYENLGIVFIYLGDYVKAKENIKKALEIANEIGALAREEANFGNLGTLFIKLGDFGNCQECLEKALTIAAKIGDRRGELSHCTNLGYVFKCLGDYEKAKEYLEKALSMATKIDDKEKAKIDDKEKEAYCHLNLGTVYLSLEDYADAENHLKEALLIATETGIRTLEAASHHRLGNLFQSLSRCDSDEAKKSYGKALAISREIGERERQAATYVDLGSLYIDGNEYVKAEEHLEKALSIGKELHHFGIEFSCYKHFAMAKIPQGKKQEALPYLLQSVQKCEDGRGFLKDNDELKVLYSDVHSFPYKKLSTLFCDIGNPNKALSVEELGRARGLSDLMAAQYSLEMPIATDPQLLDGIENVTNNLESNSTCLYISYDNSDVFLWILKRRGVVEFRRNTVDRTTNLHMFLDTMSESFRSFGILTPELCEDQSFNGFEQIPDSSHGENLADMGQRSPHDSDPGDHSVEQNLIFLCKMIIAPVADLLEGSEIIIVPDRHLYRVPFPALLDDSGKYLSETFRIRIVPSLTTLKCIQDSSADYHSQTGALIVGDPDVGKVMWKGRRKTIPQLPSARKEAEMVGRLLGVEPLIGLQATKQAVLERINSVSLIHFAAHGNEEKGEIILVPVRTGGRLPRETDCLLTVGDISQVQLRAKLVVLSCCHSGRGHIKVEGVVGMARAFLGSGARSVLVSLWAVDDEATEQLMSRFYEHLYLGVSASESLHQAMKWMRDNGFAKVSEWAPFMLIGDNVTFDFRNKSKYKHFALARE